MTSAADELALREQVFAALEDVDISGIAEVADTAGTPLHESAARLLPGARAIVVLGAELYPEILGLVLPDRVMGEAAARELYTPHVEYMNGRLNRSLYRLAKMLRAQGHRTLPLPSQGTPVDARFQRGILSFKHAAELAGLGRIGWTSLLITKEFGPRVRLACLLTDAPLPATRRETADPCADCAGACIAACPAAALAEPPAGQRYAINKYACASFRAGAGACSTCMSACVLA
jgi:epoxyqueuosine reductase QueG